MMKHHWVFAVLAGTAPLASGQERPFFDENVAHLAALSSTGFEAKPDISDDRLTLLYASDQTNTAGDLDVWVATRPDVNSPFGTQVNVAELNSADRDHTPTTTADELLIVYSSSRPGGTGDDDAWTASRASTSDAWSNLQEVPQLNSLDRDMGFTMTPDGLCLYYTSNRPGGPGGFDLYTSTRASRNDAWGAPTAVAELNTAFDDRFPTVTGDNCALYFSSNRPGSVLDPTNNPSDDIWVAMRPDASSPWTVVENVFELNTDGVELLSSVSNDHQEFFFVSTQAPSLGGLDLFRTDAIPGVFRYGVGKAGNNGMPRLRTVGGAPTPGNKSFGFEISNFDQNGRGFYWVSLDDAPGPEIWVGAPICIHPFPAGMSDPFVLSVPIADDNGLIGVTGYCQYFVLESVVSHRATLNNIAISPGLRRTVQDSK
jgi:hypothetical protein